LGQKTVTKLFPFLSNAQQYTIADVIAHCLLHKDNSKMFQSILDNQDKLEIYWKVMQLGSIELTLAGLENMRESLDAKPVFKPFQLRLMFMQDNAFKQIHHFSIWSRLMMPLNTISNLRGEDGPKNSNAVQKNDGANETTEQNSQPSTRNSEVDQ
jgi:hypothetical protein